MLSNNFWGKISILWWSECPSQLLPLQSPAQLTHSRCGWAMPRALSSCQNKNRSNGLAFITEHLKSANDLKRHNRRDLKGKWQYQIYFQFSFASIRIKSEKWRQIPARKEHGNGSVLIEENFGLHLLLPAAFHWNFVPCGQRVSVGTHQHRTDKPFPSPALSVGLNPEELQKSLFSEALFHSKKWSKEWSVPFL